MHNSWVFNRNSIARFLWLERKGIWCLSLLSYNRWSRQSPLRAHMLWVACCPSQGHNPSKARVVCSSVSRTIIQGHSSITPDGVFKDVFWFDSTITLNWINIPSHTLLTFVANRVSEIQATTQLTDWRHVPTQDNLTTSFLAVNVHVTF